MLGISITIFTPVSIHCIKLRVLFVGSKFFPLLTPYSDIKFPVEYKSAIKERLVYTNFYVWLNFCPFCTLDPKSEWSFEIMEIIIKKTA